ncbi:MAG: hypothetical protein H3Z51_03090 [archaeon]|nr:hypothetical protein [archaeon]
MSSPEKRSKFLVFTTEECSSCGLKTKRAFQSGDYVYKEEGECSKCKGKMRINTIYSEKAES